MAGSRAQLQGIVVISTCTQRHTLGETTGVPLEDVAYESRSAECEKSGTHPAVQTKPGDYSSEAGSI